MLCLSVCMYVCMCISKYISACVSKNVFNIIYSDLVPYLGIISGQEYKEAKADPAIRLRGGFWVAYTNETDQACRSLSIISFFNFSTVAKQASVFVCKAFATEIVAILLSHDTRRHTQNQEYQMC